MSLKTITPIKAFGDTVKRLWDQRRPFRALAFAAWAPIAGSVCQVMTVTGVAAGTATGIGLAFCCALAVGAAAAIAFVWHGVFRFFRDTSAWLGAL